MSDRRTDRKQDEPAHPVMSWDQVERAAKDLGADKFRVFGAHEGERKGEGGDESTVWFGATFRDEDGQRVEVISPPFENISAMSFIEGFDGVIARAFLAELAERMRRAAAVRKFREEGGAGAPDAAN
ncbi:hypothetical protein [Roseixanthobacter glucoisosaccharinicivorans]|uniref:hypothetical protein n=1 Tax=Roseixanthobacter glucoisosaccharinicivorans TaxID=3119923 RepID=UPI0037279A0C